MREIAERRIAGAEIVETQPHAEIEDLLEHFDRHRCLRA
jgi:hypothetical protein